MSMILHLGKNVKEYQETYISKIAKMLANEQIVCDVSLAAMKRHSSYTRTVKETGEEINIIFVQCTSCKKAHGHALLPDFMSKHKHYSSTEIENVIIESANHRAEEIYTSASTSTVRRWITQVGDRVIRAVSILKAIFMEMGRAMSEIALEPGHCYSELEQMLEMAPSTPKHSNKLGLANLWLALHSRESYI